MSDLKGELVSTAALANGIGPVDAVPHPADADPLERVRDELEDLIRPLQARRAELELELSELASQEERIENAIRALDGKAPVGERPKRRMPGTRTSLSPTQKAPAAQTIERVYATLKTFTSPATTKDVAEKIGVSTETVSRAMIVLREDERVRMTGTKPGKGVVPMYMAELET
jgi:phosphopantetheine adenylyltransferase